MSLYRTHKENATELMKSKENASQNKKTFISIRLNYRQMVEPKKMRNIFNKTIFFDYHAIGTHISMSPPGKHMVSR